MLFSASVRTASPPPPPLGAGAAPDASAPDADVPVLGGDWLGWQPVIGREGRPVGFRLRLHGNGDFRPLAELLADVLAGFEGDGASGLPHGLVLLAPLDRGPDDSLARWSAPRNVLLEVGSTALADAAVEARLREAQRHSLRLALRVDPGAAPPTAAQRAAFQYLVAGGAPSRPERDVALLALDVRTQDEARAAFEAGASGVIGWPLEAAGGSGNGGLRPQQQALLELIRLVQADAGVTEVEAAFKQEPVLGYMLLTLANSPAFMRSQPIASLGHAIQLLGYQRLVKWLVLLLVIASKNSKALPAIFGAVVRGLLLENCAAARGEPGLVRDECFVVGAFSLLDRITGRSLPRLLQDLPLPEPVCAAIVGSGGAYAPYLALAQALEGADALAMQQAARGLGLGAAQVRAALLQALATNDALQTLV